MAHFIEIALKIAVEAHEGQTDKLGNPYILHPLAVASKLDDIELKAAALLHDTIEDTSVTKETLLEAGIPQSVVDIITTLTHDKTTPYEDYIRGIAKNPKAKQVKLADLSHNLDPSRAKGRNEKMEAKYKNALSILLE